MVGQTSWLATPEANWWQPATPCFFPWSRLEGDILEGELGATIVETQIWGEGIGTRTWMGCR